MLRDTTLREIYWLCFAALLLCVPVTVRGNEFVDCNQNGIDDAIDLAAFRLEESGRYATGIVVESVVPADMDGDGDPDLVAGGYAIGVLVNSGAGDFSVGPIADPGGSLGSIAVGDFDGDTDLDVAAASADRADVSVLLNEGGGTLSSDVIRFPVGRYPLGIASGDLDGDGDLDLVTANFGADSISVLYNDGDGTFRSVPDLSGVDSPRSVLIADLDGDGALDIGATDRGRNNNVLLFFNEGNRAFSRPVTVPVGDGGPWSVAAGDLDNDGDLDLAVAMGHSGDVLISLNEGNRSFLPGVRYHAGERMFSVAVGNLDDDENLDIVASAPDGEGVWTFQNVGDGTFAASRRYTGGGESAIADLDGDGDGDIVTSDSTLLNRGDGTFVSASGLPAGGSTIWGDGVTTADVDGDGDLDVITANGGDGTCSSESGCGGKSVSVLLNLGAGRLSRPAFFPTGDDPHFIRTGDLDGDSDIDLVTANQFSRDISVLLNAGSGIYSEHRRYEGGGESVAVGDMDSDGHLDLVAGGSDGVSLLLNAGDGTFAAAGEGISLEGALGGLLDLGDLDSDGDLDIFTRGRRSSQADSLCTNWAVILNEGDGMFAAPIDVEGCHGSSLALGDLDGDDDLDIVTSAPAIVPYLGVLLNEGGGTFTAIDLGSPDAHKVTLGDLDGDSDLDIVTTNWDTIGVWLNDGDGGFGTTLRFSAGFEHTDSVTVGDLDDDGAVDVVATGSVNSLHVLLNAPAEPTSEDRNANGVPDECERFRRGECNDDGEINLADALCSLNWLFSDAPTPGCIAALNTNGDDSVNIADPVALLSFLFASGVAPGEPFADCGLGTLPVDEELGCAATQATCQ